MELRLTFFIAAFLLTANVCRSQSSDLDSLSGKDWKPGELTLNNRSVLKGDIYFDYASDIVRLRQNGDTKFYGKNQIIEFQIHDLDAGQISTFKSLNLPVGHGLFEVIAENKDAAFLIFRTNKSSADMVDISPIAAQSTPYRPTIDRTIYFATDELLLIRSDGDYENLGHLNPDENLDSGIKLRRMRKLLKEFDPKVLALIDKRDLDLRKRKHLLEAIKLAMNNQE